MLQGYQYHPLTPWEKILIIYIGGVFVCVTILLVSCAICPTCTLYKLWHKDELEQEKRSKGKRRDGGNGEHERNEKLLHPLSVATSTASEVGGSLAKNRQTSKRSALKSTQARTKSAESGGGGVKFRETHQNGHQGGPVPEKELLNKKASDSSYGTTSSSSTAAPSSGRNSPSSMSITSAFSNLSFSFSTKSSSSHQAGLSTDSPTAGGSSNGKKSATPCSVTLSFLWRPEEAAEASESNNNNGVLEVKIESAKDLPRRDYSPIRDPFVKITVFQDRRRSLRKRSKIVVAEFTSNVVRHELSPTFNQSFFSEVDLNELKNLRVKVGVFDYDRHTKTTEIGSTMMAMRDLKSLPTSVSPIEVANNLVLKKEEFGDLLFGLSYLPTAQRLSFSIIKASNLKLEGTVDDISEFNPYVRIIQVNPSGKVLRKKKTNTKEGGKEPIFNETLNFDLAPNQLESMNFVVMLSTKIDSPTEDASESEKGEQGSSSSREVARMKKDHCVGKVSLGRNVRGDKERALWLSVMTTPRKVFSMWHTLE